MQRIDWRKQKDDSIQHRNNCPDTCKDLPVFNSHRTEENSWNQYYSDMSPTIKRMQKAHCFFFIVCRTCLNDRTDQYFKQASTYCINGNSNQDSGKRICCKLRKQCQCQKADCWTNMRDRHRCFVSDSVYKSRRQKIYQKLDYKVDRDQKCNLWQRNLVCLLKRYK